MLSPEKPLNVLDQVHLLISVPPPISKALSGERSEQTPSVILTLLDQGDEFFHISAYFITDTTAAIVVYDPCAFAIGNATQAPSAPTTNTSTLSPGS